VDLFSVIKTRRGGSVLVYQKHAEEQVNEDQAAIIAQIQTLAAKLVM
jgi:hypothetical protein